jgi:predicted RNase H-like HicB family nuclease
MAEELILSTYYGVSTSEGGFYAYVPEISDIRVGGKTMKEARRNLAVLINDLLLDDDWLRERLSSFHPGDREENQTSTTFA